MFLGEKHTVGHIFIKELKFSKFIADINIALEMRNFDNFDGFLQSRIWQFYDTVSYFLMKI